MRPTRDESSELYTSEEAEREAILEDRDEYAAENVFWVPREARWDELLANANQSDIGSRLDRALEAIEREDPEQRAEDPEQRAEERDGDDDDEAREIDGLAPDLRREETVREP